MKREIVRSDAKKFKLTVGLLFKLLIGIGIIIGVFIDLNGRADDKINSDRNDLKRAVSQLYGKVNNYVQFYGCTPDEAIGEARKGKPYQYSSFTSDEIMREISRRCNLYDFFGLRDNYRMTTDVYRNNADKVVEGLLDKKYPDKAAARKEATTEIHKALIAIGAIIIAAGIFKFARNFKNELIVYEDEVRVERSFGRNRSIALSDITNAIVGSGSSAIVYLVGGSVKVKSVKAPEKSVAIIKDLVARRPQFQRAVPETPFPAAALGLFCHNCGKRANSDSAFCSECGAKLIKRSEN